MRGGGSEGVSSNQRSAVHLCEGFPAAAALTYMHSTLGLNLFEIKIHMCSESECNTLDWPHIFLS